MLDKKVSLLAFTEDGDGHSVLILSSVMKISHEEFKPEWTISSRYIRII